MAIKAQDIETPNFFNIRQANKRSFPAHLEIHVERMKREYNVDCTTGKPRVNFRETVTQRAEWCWTDVGFENMGASIPSNLILIPAGFYEASEKRSLSGNPISGCRLVLREGTFQAVDSSELAFRLATIGAFREAYKSARPVILETFMTVLYLSITGQVIGSLNTGRGTVIDSEVPLNDMFEYSIQLRGATQSMEFKNHQPVLPNQQKQLEEAPRKTSPRYTQLKSRQEYHRAIEYVDVQFTELEG
ncbi:hypothetical protein M378DRAFT_17006 [Amanita muscaria Koide BX008]|uniref:Uncharacterized protein n=1 Tax=Amanita muscaria (strain Koide BX008) TaxID=946122 RepID=A0A0C2SRE8_AMAMK|nr:hypothetical protein M378DRAFT_17006 [Amanita muscaria Koide BX008]